MPERRSRRISKARAIQNALGQLGWHASGKDVVAFLANYGVAVNEGLVHQVKVDNLRDAGGMKSKKAKARQISQRAAVPIIRKKPAQRTYRR